MGRMFKVIAKVWFFCWDIPALLVLLHGQFALCGAILLIAGASSGGLWLYGDHLEAKEAPSKATAWRKLHGLEP